MGKVLAQEIQLVKFPTKRKREKEKRERYDWKTKLKLSNLIIT